MKKNITAILTEGLDIWKNNLILGIPPLLDLIIQYALWILFFVVSFGVLILFLGLGAGSAFLMEDIEDVEAIFAMVGSMGAALFIWSLFLILTIVISIVIDMFFKAGLIGMAKETIGSGKSDLSAMTDYGKRKWLTLFFANLIVFAVAVLPLLIVGIILLILFIMGYSSGFDLSGGSGLYAALLIFAAIMLWIFYVIVISIILAVVDYAVVISGRGAIDAVMSSFRFFMKNKFDVFLIWLVVLIVSLFFFCIYLGVQMLLGFIPIIGTIIGLFVEIIYYGFLAFVVTPVITLWWSLLYIDREIK